MNLARSVSEGKPVLVLENIVPHKEGSSIKQGVKYMDTVLEGENLKSWRWLQLKARFNAS